MSRLHPLYDADDPLELQAGSLTLRPTVGDVQIWEVVGPVPWRVEQTDALGGYEGLHEGWTRRDEVERERGHHIHLRSAPIEAVYADSALAAGIDGAPAEAVDEIGDDVLPHLAQDGLERAAGVAVRTCLIGQTHVNALAVLDHPPGMLHT